MTITRYGFVLFAIIFASLLYHGLADVTEEEIRIAARTMGVTQRRDFITNFGVTPTVASLVWNLLDITPSNTGTKLVHLLWALMFLKTYAKEATLIAIAGVTRTTYRKWMWPMLQRIAALRFSVVSQIN